MPVNETKLRNLMLYIANHPNVQALGMTKLFKLLYFIDTRALRERGESITGSDYIKYEHGPVPSRAERLARKLRNEGVLGVEQRDHGGYDLNEILPLATPPEESFAPLELEIIEEVLRRLGNKTAKYLSELSHLEPAWTYARKLGRLDHALMLYGTEEDPEGL